MTEPARPKIAPRRVQCAFGDEAADVKPMIVIDVEGERATLRTVSGKVRRAVIADASGFTAALDRADLTRVREHPFLVVNARRGLIALAFGPAELPDRIEMAAGVVRLEDGGAVEIPGGDGQPSWLLFEADIT